MNETSLTSRVKAWLALERNISVMLVVIVLLGMGEELWTRFIPKYLEILGATAWVVAWYGTLRDFLDAVYQYPGGWLSDKLGRRTSLVIFTLLAIVGYSLYLFSASWMLLLVGTVFVMAWSSLTLPAMFSMIGDHLPSHQRTMGFGVQALIKRIPIVIAPGLGGLLILSRGFVPGIKLGLLITIGAALAAICVLLLFYEEKKEPPEDDLGFRQIWRDMEPALKKLLVTDCLARWAEGLAEVFIILYAINVVGVTAFQFGWLVSVQMLVSIVLYIPISRLADKFGRRPFVLMTFTFFALYPLAIALSGGLAFLAVAFVIGGLREIGEPARKATIIDLTGTLARARTVGTYYLIRGLVVFPASLAGGLLWNYNNHFPFYAAFAAGMVGVGYFVIVERKVKIVRA